MKLFVVTKSEARKQILKNIRFKFEEYQVDFPEEVLDDPVETVKYNSLGKHEEACKHVDGLVITFDTVVYWNGEIFGKPKDYSEAYEMLSRLSGEVHKVYTGVTFGDRDRRFFGYGETEVKFIDIPEDLLRWYLDREPYWKFAGGYRIQGLASLFVEYVKGDFFNVIGVPIQTLMNLIRKYGLEPRKFMD